MKFFKIYIVQEFRENSPVIFFFRFVIFKYTVFNVDFLKSRLPYRKPTYVARLKMAIASFYVVMSVRSSCPRFLKSVSKLEFAKNRKPVFGTLQVNFLHVQFFRTK